VGVARALADFGLPWSKADKRLGDSPPWTPTNRRAYFDAANFDEERVLRGRGYEGM